MKSKALLLLAFAFATCHPKTAFRGVGESKTTCVPNNEYGNPIIKEKCNGIDQR